jgi:acyl-CoA synthetase (AMP-forming)/AMP-acid ligase II
MSTTWLEAHEAARQLFPLTGFGDAPALLDGGRVVTYAELDERVRQRVDALGPVRRLVLLTGGNDVETVVSYLAALRGGHPLLLASPDVDGSLLSTYRPDVVVSGAVLEERRPGTAHDLHPDLTLMLSTSGSTCSPKLVRLSHENVRSNAASISTYLGLTADDRAATSLPLHYCYGLSVLSSHLAVGASLLLTDLSVADERFWTEFRDAEATSFAGVPYTFDLLDAGGFADRDLPSLRYLTQAGGRMAPDRVRHYARLGRERGFDLVVMYGQTEATARIAYLPADLAEARPDCIGIAVPGGSLRLEPVDGPVGSAEVGELVYSGPNVMLGYATEPADLARGRAVEELRTGDLARQHEDGLWQIVGRQSRFAKIFGLRLDLDRVEALAAADGVAARAVEHDGRLVLFVSRHLDVASVRTVAARCGLPAHAVAAHVVTELPTTSTGKPDHATLERHAAILAAGHLPDAGERPVTPERVRDLYAELLGRPDATVDDSFVSLHGDSLSFVEASVQLVDLLDDLPPGWAELSAQELASGWAATARPARRTWRRQPVETSLVLRAAAIVLIVGTHANLLTIMGGAHILLAVTGFHLARFQLTDRSRTDRWQGLLRSARNVALPSVVWIGTAAVFTRMYDASTALFLNFLLGSSSWDDRWQFWFLEAAVWSTVALAALVSVPVLDRLERHRPFATAGVAVAVTLGLRYGLVGVEAGPTERYALPVVLCCVALGWLAARADTVRRRSLTTLVAWVGVWGFFGDPVREVTVAGGVTLLVWVPRISVSRPVVRLLGVVGASSLFVYLTHWQVYPHLEDDHPLLATLSSFAVGIGCWRVYDAVRVSVRPRAGGGQEAYPAFRRRHAAS